MIKDRDKVDMSFYLRDVPSSVSVPKSCTNTCLTTVPSCVIHTHCKNTSEILTSIELL